MDFSIKTLDAKTSVNAAKTGVLVVGVFENRKLTQAAQALDKSGAISDALKSGDITGKPGSTLLLRGVAGVAAERVLLVGLGADEEIADKSFSSATQGAVRALTTVGEHGPELLFLPRGAGVLPSRQTLRLLSKFASATDRSRIPVSVGTPATGGVGGGMRGLRIEGTLDTPWGPSDIRGVVVEELREDHVFDSSRERTRR